MVGSSSRRGALRRRDLHSTLRAHSMKLPRLLLLGLLALAGFPAPPGAEDAPSGAADTTSIESLIGPPSSRFT